MSKLHFSTQQTEYNFCAIFQVFPRNCMVVFTEQTKFELSLLIIIPFARARCV